MNLNNTISFPSARPLSRSELMSMENILRCVRQSGEIHVETTGKGLTLKLKHPHHALNGDPLDDKGLARRDISESPEFGNLKKIAITETALVLFPMPAHGARKRTLKFFKRGWVCTKRTFFSDFTITDTAG